MMHTSANSQLVWQVRGIVSPQHLRVFAWPRAAWQTMRMRLLRERREFTSELKNDKKATQIVPHFDTENGDFFDARKRINLSSSGVYISCFLIRKTDPFSDTFFDSSGGHPWPQYGRAAEGRILGNQYMGTDSVPKT